MFSIKHLTPHIKHQGHHLRSSGRGVKQRQDAAAARCVVRVLQRRQLVNLFAEHSARGGGSDLGSGAVPGETTAEALRRHCVVLHHECTGVPRRVTRHIFDHCADGGDKQAEIQFTQGAEPGQSGLIVRDFAANVEHFGASYVLVVEKVGHVEALENLARVNAELRGCGKRLYRFVM